MTPQYENKVVLSPSLVKFMFDFQELVQQGYEIDPQRVPIMNGFQYETGLRREILELTGDFPDVDTLQTTSTEEVELKLCEGPLPDIKNPEEVIQQAEKIFKKPGRPPKNKP